MSNEVLKFDWTKFDAERAAKGGTKFDRWTVKPMRGGRHAVHDENGKRVTSFRNETEAKRWLTSQKARAMVLPSAEPYILDRWGHKIACAEDPPHGEGVVLTFDWAKFDAERGHGFVSGRDQKALKRSVATAPKSPRPRDENNLAARPHAEIHHGNTSKGIIGRLFGSKGTPVTVHDPD